MKCVSVLRHCLISFLAQSRPFHVLVIIVSNRVEFLLKGIYKGRPSGFSPQWCRFICGVPLLVTFPPRSDMGKGFKEHKGDLFTVNFFLDGDPKRIQRRPRTTQNS
jgi:hypothetical protein